MSGIDSLGLALREATEPLDSTLQAATEEPVVWVILVYHDGRLRMAANAPRDIAEAMILSAAGNIDTLTPEQAKGH